MPKQYRHYKGGIYNEVGVAISKEDKIEADYFILATHTETREIVEVFIKEDVMFTYTDEELMIYKDQKGKTWARPSSMFFETVILEDDSIVPRFHRI